MVADVPVFFYILAFNKHNDTYMKDHLMISDVHNDTYMKDHLMISDVESLSQFKPMRDNY